MSTPPPPPKTPPRTPRKRRGSGTLLFGTSPAGSFTSSGMRPLTPASLGEYDYDWVTRSPTRGCRRHGVPGDGMGMPPSAWLNEGRSRRGSNSMMRSASSSNLLLSRELDEQASSVQGSPRSIKSAAAAARRLSSLLFAPLFTSSSSTAGSACGHGLEPPAPIDVVCLTPRSAKGAPQVVSGRVRADSLLPELDDDPFAPDPVSSAKPLPAEPHAQSRRSSGRAAGTPLPSVLFAAAPPTPELPRRLLPPLDDAGARVERARSKSFSGVPLAWMDAVGAAQPGRKQGDGRSARTTSHDPLWDAAYDGPRSVKRAFARCSVQSSSAFSNFSACHGSGLGGEDEESEKASPCTGQSDEELDPRGSAGKFERSSAEASYWKLRTVRQSLEPAFPDSGLESPLMFQDCTTETAKADAPAATPRPAQQLAPSIELLHTPTDGRLSIPGTLLYDFERYEREHGLLSNLQRPPLHRFDRYIPHTPPRTLPPSSPSHSPAISPLDLQRICARLISLRRERGEASDLRDDTPPSDRQRFGHRSSEDKVPISMRRRSVQLSISTPPFTPPAPPPKDTAPIILDRPPQRPRLNRKKSIADLLAECVSSVKAAAKSGRP